MCVLRNFDSLIFTCFTYSKALKCLTLLIIKTYILACPISKISQFIIYKPSNFFYTSFIFNILHFVCTCIYNYQGERTWNQTDRPWLVDSTEVEGMICTFCQEYWTILDSALPVSMCIDWINSKNVNWFYFNKFQWIVHKANSYKQCPVNTHNSS